MLESQPSCPKCRGERSLFRIIWCKAGCLMDDEGYPASKISEALIVACPCGFSWSEKCADSED